MVRKLYHSESIAKNERMGDSRNWKKSPGKRSKEVTA